jgi:hypothetical protein
LAAFHARIAQLFPRNAEAHVVLFQRAVADQDGVA